MEAESIPSVVLASLLLLCSLQGGCAQGCGLADIGINQTRTGEIVNGLDEYEVVISNNCVCSQTTVMLRCSGFNSTEEVDPKLFRFVGDSLCSVNEGRPLRQGSPIIFNYAWSNPQIFFPGSSVIIC